MKINNRLVHHRQSVVDQHSSDPIRTNATELLRPPFALDKVQRGLDALAVHYGLRRGEGEIAACGAIFTSAARRFARKIKE